MHSSFRPVVFVYPAAAVLTTMALAALVCRLGCNSGKRISYNILAATPLIANAAIFMCFALCSIGTDAFSLAAWDDIKDLKSVCVAAGATAGLCLFPVMAVAFYYELRNGRQHQK
jgi:hypothetical protein